MQPVKLKPSARRVLNRLREGPATTHDLIQPEVGGGRFGARLKEIRTAGYVIAEEHIRRGSHRYTLTFDAERDIDDQPDPRSLPSGAPLATESVDVPLGAESLFDGDAYRRSGMCEAA